VLYHHIYIILNVTDWHTQDHVCERHVGRKSTNNLNLTCQWGACRTTTVKRDHITSHIRVHVPLKPHKCDFCGKAFKRPQDLKKHVKTHADDSVLMNSPSQGNSRGAMGGAGGMGAPNGKREYHSTYHLLDSNRPDANPYAAYGYSPAHHDGGLGNPYPAYNPNIAASNGYPPANGQYAGYGSVNYPNNSAVQDLQSMDTRRRAIEALNDFLGDIKRRAIDPSAYYDVGQRLQSNALPLPVGNGYNTGYSNPSTGYSNYNTASLLESFTQGNNMGGGGGVGLASQQYSLPLPNARTKNDLQDIDRFLEQLQATVYETSNHAAAAGVQQPGAHAMHTGDWGMGNTQAQYRSSNSPPSYSNNGSSVGGVSAMSSGMNMPNATSTALDTPALTPAASVSSYASSGHSPISNNRASLGSLGGYPNLPSVTGMSDLGAGYPTTTSAPASGLATGYESLDGRRYSGGRLQRAAPDTAQRDTEMTDYDDGSRTPKASESRGKSRAASSIDPALRGEDEKSPSDAGSTPADEKRQEEWVENIRVIEAIKKWVTDRLNNGEYESEEAAAEDAKPGVESDDSVKLAKLVEEKMADADVSYPTLPSSS
jgi:hypothetical protein